MCVIQGGKAQRRQRQAEENLKPYIGRVEPSKTLQSQRNTSSVFLKFQLQVFTFFPFGSYGAKK